LLSKQWENGMHLEWGMHSEWEGQSGFHNERDVSRFVPFAISRLRRESREGYDAYGMGPGNDRENSMNIDGPDYTGDDPVPDRRARIVRHLSRDYFRKRLVEHFAIRF
jgi:hypothetical protein